MRTKWENELDYLREQVSKGITMEEIGSHYGVSRQRIYQIINKFNIKTIHRKRTRMLEEFDDPKRYWLNKTLTTKSVPKPERLVLLREIILPNICPCLGLELDYSSKDSIGYAGRQESSPSMDKLIPSEGYVLGNINIISWRANRIKNDGTVEEIFAIGNWVKEKLTGR